MPRKPATPRTHHDPRLLAERSLHEPGDGGSANRSVTVNLAESPLSWLHARGYVTDRQLLAGETLRGDYEKAMLGPQVTMRWENIPLSRQRRGPISSFNESERMIAAKARFDQALEAVGPDLRDIAWRVICAGESLPAAERDLAWPARSGKIVLRIALDRLAQFYKLPG